MTEERRQTWLVLYLADQGHAQPSLRIIVDEPQWYAQIVH
jgi:hypothetical protein